MSHVENSLLTPLVVLQYNVDNIMLEAWTIMNDMDAIDRAIAQRQGKIERLQKFVEELRDAERELSTLLDARRIVALDAGRIEASTPEQVRFPEPRRARRGRPVAQRSLTADILRVLDLAEQEISLAEIHREVEKTRGPTQKNALSSTVSRLVKEERIRRPVPGRYAAMRPGKSVTASLPENGMEGTPHIEEQAQPTGTREASSSFTE